MHELILLRHAEAEPPEKAKDDRSRTLTEHGKREARDTAKWFAEHHIEYDRILCSPAVRTKETAMLALTHGKPQFVEEIYDATPGDLMAVLDKHHGVGRVVLVGHNPGIEQLVALLVDGRSDDYRGMPPGGVARLTLQKKGSIEPGIAKLEAFWSPSFKESKAS
ncbi:phosphohistidine phosphatase SixA [Luteibacter rhizovicinus]|uniref:Phosphohistidine phosphatase SixA n=1 Tax=Luteibacter rhizovicinus TaxID=242606 RepID=A0A4R3YUU2_9GAMM|nr:histidine phosphatase family protein [Luteibacter rhizovicinus]TCV96330.1 phosphohistidine phosphatase SixA [Luteibacter rhizovicinus]